MSTIYLPRTAWTRHGPVRPMDHLIPSEVAGFAVHWPGTSRPIGDPGMEAIAARLEGYRRYHTDPKPAGKEWSDIAYHAAVDQAGRVWSCRDLGYRSAANGSTEDNRRFGGLLLLVGPGEQPTAAMVQAVRDWGRQRWLARYPDAARIVGHGDIRDRPTDCPGPAVEQLLEARAFTPTTSQPRPPKPPAKTWTETLMDQLPIVRHGDTGEDVQSVQGLLLARGQNVGDAGMDGVFGDRTRDAVRRLQRAAGIGVDGVVGPDTWAALHRRRR